MSTIDAPLRAATGRAFDAAALLDGWHIRNRERSA